MSDAIKNTLRAKGPIILGVGGVLFSVIRGIIDYSSIMDLESGKVEVTNVWGPVATLYDYFGLPYALIPHVIFAVLMLIVIITSIRENRTLKTQTAEEGTESLRKIQENRYDQSFIIGHNWATWKKYISLITASLIVSTIIYVSVIFIASMK